MDKNDTAIDRKVLSLQKENEQFVFRYSPGTEEDVLDTFIDMANNDANNFDWFDAAVLSFQLSKNLVEEADKLLCPDSGFDRSADRSVDEFPWDFL